MKKIILILLALVMVLSTTTLAFCNANTSTEIKQTATLECRKNISNVWNAGDSKDLISKGETNSEDMLVHNNGNAIKTDIFTDGKSEGNYLVAVLCTEQNGDLIENYYFTNEPDGDKARLMTRVAENQGATLQNPVPITRAGTGSVIKTYNWEYKSGSTIYARLSTNVTLKRKTSTATINGKQGSVWDVTTFTQLEKVKATRITSYYTRLSVDQTNQKLLSYGPVGNTSGGSLSVSLTGLTATAAYNFSISGFSVKDYSSVSGKYGRWLFYDGAGSLGSMTSKPGIRATNTSGSFVLELSHVTEINTASELGKQYQTGVIQIWATDR